jgi:hypothetical protein
MKPDAAGGRLVEEQDPWASGDGHGQVEPALLTARQLPGPYPCPAREVHQAEEFGAITGRTGETEPQVEGLRHGQLGEQAALLHHDPELGSYLSAIPVRVAAQDADGTGLGGAETLEGLQDRGLPGPVGAEECEQLTRADLERDTPYGLERAVPLVEAGDLDCE